MNHAYVTIDLAYSDDKSDNHCEALLPEQSYDTLMDKAGSMDGGTYHDHYPQVHLSKH